jgi:uncharacterized protein (AIM24 family)
MSYNTAFLRNTQNKQCIAQLGKYYVMQYKRDLSVAPGMAMQEYFASAMNVCKRQVAIELGGGNGTIIQAGAMQWMLGDVEASTNVKGLGDLIGKSLSSRVTGETAIKPRYTSRNGGLLVLEPTYKHILLLDVGQWREGLTIEDGLFLACDDTIQLQTVSRRTLSSAALGGEGLFNTNLVGKGIAVLESYVPMEELVEVELQNDTIKIDGNFAIAWSRSLDFTVERTTKTLIGSAASGEGFVNVYRGTGRILMAPLATYQGGILERKN